MALAGQQHDVARAGFIERQPDGDVRRRLVEAVREVVADRRVEQERLLREKADSPPERREVVVLGPNAVLIDAFWTDVRPALAAWRAGRGLPEDPMAAFAASGYLRRIAEERTGGVQAGWGA